MRIKEVGAGRFSGAREAECKTGVGCSVFWGADESAGKLAIMAKWREVCSHPFERIKLGLKQRVVFDERNLYELEVPHSPGIEYSLISRRFS